MVEELQAETNLWHRVIATIREESRAVTISQVALVVAVLALLMAWMGAYSANKAEIRSELLVDDLTIEKNRATLYIVYVQDLRSWMIEQGYEPPPLPEDE